MTSQANNTRELLEEFGNLFSPAMLAELESTGLNIVESRGDGAYVFDLEGRRYLDCNCSAGTYNLGRANEALIAELRRAIPETDQGNFPMISKEKAAIAKALSDFVPADLECVVFSVVRGEAMEFACKVARGFTRLPELVTVDGGWYGQTGFALSLSQREDKYRYGPLIPGVREIRFGDIDHARETIGKDTAAVILEPIQAENHCRVAQRAYLEELESICQKNGALLILDETQTGFGRVGRKFAFSAADVQPDILIVGEALGAGVFPIAATLMTQRVNAFMNEHPLIHLSTFGGSDLGCRIGAKAVELYREMAPWENARSMGSRLRSGIESIMKKTTGSFRSVAGAGLLLSIEMEDADAAKAFCRRLAENGVLAFPGMVAKNTVLLRPSLLITENEAGEILTAIEAALS